MGMGTGNAILSNHFCLGVSRARKHKRSDGMPDANVIDKEFLMQHKLKVQKIYSQKTKEVEISTITKNHLYPQCGGSSANSAGNAKKFLQGLQNNNLGNISTNEKGRPCFKLVDFENADAGQLQGYSWYSLGIDDMLLL